MLSRYLWSFAMCASVWAGLLSCSVSIGAHQEEADIATDVATETTVDAGAEAETEAPTVVDTEVEAVAEAEGEAVAETEAEAVAEAEGEIRGIIDFARDVRPILTAKCLECHGPDEAKNDFRVDDADTLLSYLEPRDVAGSSLWTDYLLTEDEDMLMPPSSVEPDKRLTAAELATIKLWIEEGGMWDLMSEATEEQTQVVPLSLAERIWKFQGLLHPATTHFPIALLTVSALFVFLSYFRPETCEPVAFHCLWIGALGAIVASAAGWSYAVTEGYGAGYSFDVANSAIDRHRWAGIAVAVLGVVLIPLAAYVQSSYSFGLRSLWLAGSLLLLVAVGITGFQGGELTYGEGHYEKEFIHLFPEVFPQAEINSEKDTANEPDAASQGDEDEDEDEDAETETESMSI